MFSNSSPMESNLLEEGENHRATNEAIGGSDGVPAPGVSGPPVDSGALGRSPGASG